MKKKITFICPTTENLRIRSLDEKPKGTIFLRLPSLSGATLSALTPKEFEFKLIDEQLDFLDFNEPTDLVAITCNTATAKRTYEIAKMYHKKGIPVVIGGIHPTLNKEETMQYGIAIVGSAEPIWKTILKDFKKNDLKKVYLGKLNKLKLMKPDRTIFHSKDYMTVNLVEASRGCIHKCNFCTTANAFNGKFITKKISDVVDEIKSLDKGIVIFVDDNLIGDIKNAKKLFKALIPLKIKWVSQVTYLFGLDKKLLNLARKSGCIGVFIGFDSISMDTLQDYQKSFGKKELYEKAIRNIHEKEILIQGSFIFGSDSDTKDVFEETFNFVQENKIDGIFFGLYTPLPGTQLFSIMEKSQRIIHKNWDDYNYRNCVFRPKNMSQKELLNGVDNILSQYFRKDRIFLRLIRTLKIMIKRKSFLLFAGYYLGFLSRIKMLNRLKSK